MSDLREHLAEAFFIDIYGDEDVESWTEPQFIGAKAAAEHAADVAVNVIFRDITEGLDEITASRSRMGVHPPGSVYRMRELRRELTTLGLLPSPEPGA